MPLSVRNLQVIANLILFVFIALAISECVVVRQQFSAVADNFILIQDQFAVVSQAQMAAFNTRSLSLKQRGLHNMSDLMMNNSYEDLDLALHQMYSLQNEMNLQKVGVSEEHSRILSDKVIQMYF